MLILLTREDFAQLAREEYAYDTIEVAVQVYPADRDCLEGEEGGNGEKVFAGWSCEQCTYYHEEARRYCEMCGAKSPSTAEGKRSRGAGDEAFGASVGSVQHALAFKSASCAVTGQKRMLPTARYISLIQEGARTSEIEPQYCEWLDEIPHS